MVAGTAPWRAPRLDLQAVATFCGYGMPCEMMVDSSATTGGARPGPAPLRGGCPGNRIGHHRWVHAGSAQSEAVAATETSDRLGWLAWRRPVSRPHSPAQTACIAQAWCTPEETVHQTGHQRIARAGGTLTTCAGSSAGCQPLSRLRRAPVHRPRAPRLSTTCCTPCACSQRGLDHAGIVVHWPSPAQGLRLQPVDLERVHLRASQGKDARHLKADTGSTNTGVSPAGKHPGQRGSGRLQSTTTAAAWRTRPAWRPAARA
jgi:hypothetical protein